MKPLDSSFPHADLGGNDAEERLLQAELEQVLGRPHADFEPSRPPDHRSRWIWAGAAAAGIAITTAVWFGEQADPASNRTANPAPSTPSHQDPEASGPRPIPRPVHAKLGEIESVPDGVEHLVCTLGGISDFARLDRFTKLRKLAILPLRPPGGRLDGEAAETFYWTWTLADETALNHLLEMKHLEHLHLPSTLSLRPAVLGPLRRLPALRVLTLAGEGAAPTGELATTLASMPHLRELELQTVPVGAGALAHLRRVPLRRLDLFRCTELDRPSLAAIGQLGSLESLGLRALERQDRAGEGQPRPRAIEADDLAFLGELPKLRELSLAGSVIDRAGLDRLPKQLEALDLWAVQLADPADLHRLAHLETLARLRVNRHRSGLPLRYALHMEPEVAFADALARGLESADLRSLTFGGVLTPALAVAIGAQIRLQELDLTPHNHPDIGAFSELRELRRVTWRRASVTIEALEPLTHAPQLQTLDFWGSGVPSREALERLFPRARFPDLVIRIDGA